METDEQQKEGKGRLPGNNITISLSPLRIVGSKKKLIQKYDLMNYFPDCVSYKRYNEVKGKHIIHRRIYVELFAGSAVLFLNLDPVPLYAILNDVDHDIFNFWNVIKEKYDEFIKELEFTWCGQDWIDKFTKRDDDVGRAIFFYVKNRFSNIIQLPVRFPKQIEFNDWKKRLDRARLQIWNYDYKDALSKLNKMEYLENDNSMEFLIFEDPPYHGTESFYGSGFKEEDHRTLAKLNHESTHHIILTYNDSPLIRELYKDWYCIEMDNYTSFKVQYNKELLLSNKPLMKKQSKIQGTQQKVI